MDCSMCGHSNRPAARFCDECGAPFPSGPTGRDPTDQAHRSSVTVLFSDLVDSTRFADGVDAESAREVINRYHALVRRVVEEHGGAIHKFIGDGVLAVFGVPEVSDDDARRSVMAALAIQRQFADVREHVARAYGFDLDLRIGINSGEVVLSPDDDDIVGDVLNTAARIERSCVPGEVLVGESTWRLTRASVRYDEPRVLIAKGKGDRLLLHRVLDVVAEHDAATPFVGRSHELQRLDVVLADVARRRGIGLTTVIGAPGIGKTRLAHEVAVRAAPAWRVIEVRCRRSRRTTFAPIIDLVRAVTDFHDDDHDAALERLRAVVGPLDDGRIVDALANVLGFGSARPSEESFYAVRRLLELLGRDQPLLLVVDDLQWAQPLFLDLLEHVVDWGRDTTVSILGLARPELRDVRQALTAVGHHVSQVIALEGLDAADTVALAGELVGGAPLPGELVDRLPRSSHGNPLFVREMVRMLVDDEIIVRAGATWVLSIDVDAITVPPTVQSLLAARIDRLQPTERWVIELASVVGSEFTVGSLLALADAAADATTVEEALRSLSRREMIAATTSVLGGEPVYAFHHVLIRDAAYRRLLKARRADLHLLAAAWLDGATRDLIGDHELAVVHHYERAHEYRRELSIAGPDTDEIGRRAADMLGAAARRALQHEDLALAASLAERAISRLDPPSAALTEMVLLACEAHLGLGAVGQAHVHLRRLGELVGDDERLAARARCLESQHAVMTQPGGLAQVVEAVTEAASRLEALGDRSGVASARLVAAGALTRLGRVGECEVELSEALIAARAADDRRLVAAVLAAAPVAALWGPSPVESAEGRCLDVLRLLRITAHSPEVEAVAMRCQGVLEALRGRFDIARQMIASARATVEELGTRRGTLETDLYEGIVELLAGDAFAAEPPLRAAYGGLGQLGIGADAGQAAGHLARSLLLQGRLHEADELAAESDALAGQNPQTAIIARAVEAEVLASAGHLEDALRMAIEAVDLADDTDILVERANAHLTLARVRSRIGDADGARRAAESAVRLFRSKGAVPPVVDEFAPTEHPPHAGRDRPLRATLQAPVPSTTGAVVAERGPLALVESDAGVMTIVQRSSDGSSALLAEFPVGELQTGLDELHRLSVRTLGDLPYLAVLQRWAALYDAVNAGDIDTAMDTFRPEWSMRDHRPLGWGDIDVRATRERFETLAALDGTVTLIVVRVRQIRFPHATVEIGLRRERPGQGAQIDRYLLVGEQTADGRWLGVDQYLIADEGAASARLAALPPIGSPSSPLNVAAWIGAIGCDAEERRVLAVRGDRLALVELSRAGARRLVVEECDDTGQLAPPRDFPADVAGLACAAEHLERRWCRIQLSNQVSHASTLQGWLAWTATANGHDPASLAECLTEGYVMVDHRPLGYGTITRDEIIAAITAGGRAATVSMPSEVLHVGDAGAVVRSAQWQPGPSGEMINLVPAVAVIAFDHGRASRMELFSDGAVVDAFARFTELTSSAAVPPHGTAPALT